MHVYKQFGAIIVPPAGNITKIKTPAQVLSSKFYKFFQPTTLLIKTLQYRYFLVNAEKFLSRQLI